MLKSSGLTAELSLQALPMLPGAKLLLEENIESTLAPSNRESCTTLEMSTELRNEPITKILFDPQTSGGLLLAVTKSKLDQLLDACGPQATVIGQVVEQEERIERIRLQP